MATKNEERWRENYAQLKAYIEEHHQLPDKKKVENRGLLNWWKYNRRLVKQGKLDTERTALLKALGAMRDSMRASFFIMTLCLLAASCSRRGAVQTDTGKAAAETDTIAVDTALQGRLAAFAGRPRPDGKFAFHVFDLTADKPVYGCNDTTALPAASCIKLLTGIAGLRLLGTAYHYWNGIFARGTVAPDGTLHGDLAFRGGLDPQLTSEDLRPFAQAVRRRGVRRLGGRLLVSLTITEPVKSEEHWFPWDLSFSRYGLLYKGAPGVIRHLKAALRAQGVAVADSQVTLAHIPRGFRCLHVSRRPIDDVVRRMWKNSANTQATAMLYTIGCRLSPDGNPVATGADYLRSFLRDTLRFTSPSLTIHDGCGLCTHNRLSPAALTALLRYGYRDPSIRPFLERNLAVAGTDGTLARELTSPSTRGKIRAKTGTLSHPYGISSLAGLCQAKNGHALAFAIMDSEMSVLDARVLQRRLCEALTKE